MHFKGVDEAIQEGSATMRMLSHQRFVFAHAKKREYAGRGLSDHLEVTHGEGTPMTNRVSATNRRIEEPRPEVINERKGHSDFDSRMATARRTHPEVTPVGMRDGREPWLGLPVVARRQRAA